jgi:hypothetical protein
VSRSTIIIAVLVIVIILGSRPVFAAKPGAILSAEPEIQYARGIIAGIWKRHGYTLTVTSGYDGSHSAQSLHYVGLAEDYRTNDVKASDLAAMITEVRAALGSFYDVVNEATHLHVEFDPK